MTKIIRAQTLADALACLAKAVAEREERGEKNLIFCEDRLTLLAERAVLSLTGGTFYSEVTTFARFLSSSRRVLSKQGSVVKVSELVLKSKGAFGSGAARAVYETLAQLAASSVTADMLKEAAQNTDGMLRSKIIELAEISEKYNGFLCEHGLIDESGYLSLLPQKIKTANLTDTNVFFFAFSSFTKQAMAGVEAALDCAKSVTGIFLGGDAPVYTNGATHAFCKLLEERGQRGNVVDMPSSLTGERAALFAALCAPARERKRAENIYAFEEENETQELNRIAALIKKQVAEGARYRDIAVLVSNEEYFLAAEKVFGAYRIPYYAERKRKLSSHPFAEYALNILDAVSDGVLPDEADAIASSLCFGRADGYRNYLARFACYRGGAKRKLLSKEQTAEYNREELERCHKKINETLALFPERAKGSDYTSAVRSLFSATRWEKILADVIENAARFGGGLSLEEQEFLTLDFEGHNAFFKVLDEVDTVAGERTFGAREFAQILKAGLDAQEISMLPAYSDAVFLGDLTRSAYVGAKTLFAAGLTQDVPVVSEDTAIITDGEIARLSDVKVEIEPAIQVVNARAKESLVLNLIGYSNRVFFSRPLQLKGEETQKSEMLIAVEKSFFLPPMPAVFPYDCSEITPAAIRMLAEHELFGQGATYSAARYNAIAEALKERGVLPQQAAEHENSALAPALWFNGAISPTLLESYFDCPYAGFAMKGLRLEERSERVADADAGIFVHTVLQRVARYFNDVSSAEELTPFLHETIEGLLKEPRFSSLADTKEGAYRLQWLERECASVAAAAYSQLASSAFLVRGTEEAVSLDALSLKGKADRVDEAAEHVRVIDYKTGGFFDDVTSYYTGRSLQLELYLLGSMGEKKPAGAFYFPAVDGYSKTGDTRFRMRGFYNADDEVYSLLDKSVASGEKSVLFEGGGMAGEDFNDFLAYAQMVGAQAEGEMKEGNIAPSPYGEKCKHCELGAMCGFTGRARKEREAKCAEIVEIVRGEKK